MTDTDGNGGVEIVAVVEAEQALARQRRVELVFVIIAAFGMTATGIFSAWSALRIQSCTTPEGRCYKDTTVRAREANRRNQERAAREHEVLKCLLLIPPLERTDQHVINCGG